MAYAFVVLAEVENPHGLVDVEVVERAVGAWHALGLRNLSSSSADFHINTGSGDLYAEIDLEEEVLSGYFQNVGKGAIGHGSHPNTVISWTASGESPDLSAMREITKALLGEADFVVWDEIGGARSEW